MPPVTKAGSEQFRKDVAFVTKDDDEQVAAGIVMVPDKADLQHDFAREGTIRSFADQFEAFYEADEAGGGIMHAVFPDGWMDLERNEVLDEAEEIGGETIDAGAWVQEWRINEDALWELIGDGILEGYSIGAIDVRWDGPFEQDADAVDDVDVPDDLGDDPLVWELTDGIIREVSAVDIPAVPDAEILEVKADAEKRLGDYLGDPDGFLEEALDRGHTEAEAERLWEVLNEAVDAEGSDTPGKQSSLQRAAKAFLSALSRDGSEADSDPHPTSDPTFGADDGADASKSPEDPDGEASKEGRTLSTANQNSLFATVDAAADVLEDAGIEHGIDRFTDRDEWDFDLSEHTAREWPDGEDGGDGPPSVDNVKAILEDGTDTDVDASDDKHASGDTPDEGGTEAADDSTETDMTDDPTDDGGDDDKSLAEQNAEQINELTQAVEDLTEGLTGPEAKTAEIEIGGETYEVREDAAKAALGVDEESDIGVAEAIERLNEKAGRVDEVEERLDTIAQQSGVGGQSQQLEAAAAEDGGEEENLDQLGKMLN